MKCSEVPIMPVLEFIDSCQRGEKFWYPTNNQTQHFGEKVAHNDACSFHGYENSLYHAIPKGVHPLGVAKILIREGLIDGCTCGCRGDFVLTERGKNVLEITRKLQ